MTQALRTLLELAERRRDDALAALLQTEDALRRLRQQAQQLHGYRDDYRRRHPALGGRSAGIDLLRCHQDFMQRLENAMAQQHGQTQAAEARASAQRTELLDHELRVASVRKLLQRRADEQRRVAARQDQRRSDDAALQRRPDGGAPLLHAWRNSGYAPLAAHG